MLRDPKLLALTERVCGAVLSRRGSQIDRGYDAAHDDEHRAGEIVTNPDWGAVARLQRAATYTVVNSPDRREELMIAAALIIAEIERIDRARMKEIDDDYY